jgi:hypothetical protein
MAARNLSFDWSPHSVRPLFFWFLSCSSTKIRSPGLSRCFPLGRLLIHLGEIGGEEVAKVQVVHLLDRGGFPQDTQQEIDEHLEALREMDPTWASFYILCPIPGTEQYDDFLAGGLITEKNLDRFDTTCLTWRHPYFSRERLSQSSRASGCHNYCSTVITSFSPGGTRCITSRMSSRSALTQIE